MLTDSAALGLAWFAARAMLLPRDSEKSYGHDRFSVLAALINGLGLIAIVIAIGAEAVHRLIEPEPVRALPMLLIASTGFLVNSAAFLMLHGADRDNLNIRAALLHVLGDILASLAAVAAAIIILLRPGWTAADPILSVVAGGLILRNAVDLVRRSWNVLMEATPEGVDVGAIKATLASLEGVADIHHLHAWSLVPGKPLITLHARVAGGHESDTVLHRIKHRLSAQFAIDHSTIQMERACADDFHAHAGHHEHDRTGSCAKPGDPTHDHKLAATS
jgi:cobalt-zinc-cadmium efflux system protein